MRRAALMLLAVVFGYANAANFTVTNLDNGGAGSLRDAVAQANANPGPDVITFSVTGTIVLTSGQISINDALTITGPGANALTIDGNANSRIFSIFENVPDVCATPGADFPVSISGLTLTNARRGGDIPGGAMYSEKTLTLSSVVISNSVAKEGGGLALGSRYAGQSLTIEDSQFIGNSAQQLSTSTSGTNGGALHFTQRCGGAAPPTTVTIRGSVFSGNRAVPSTFASAGAGIWVGVTGATISIADSRVVGNTIVTQSPSTGSNNRGGGMSIDSADLVRIERTEISDNSADRAAGLRVLNANPGRQTAGAVTRVQIVNSTISGNVAATIGTGAGGIGTYGNVALEISNSTVSTNAAQGGAPGGIGVTTGATVPASGSNALAGTLTLTSSILGGNTAPDVGSDGSVPSLQVSATRSLVTSIQAGATIVGANNIQGVSPGLGGLAFNGGSTRTQAVLAGSPAIDAGSNPLSLTTDQRGAGFPRTIGAGTDIGAYERDTTPPPPVSNQPIPTLSEYALWLLALLTAGAGALALRRRT